jgi:hypothetical protein
MTITSEVSGGDPSSPAGAKAAVNPPFGAIVIAFGAGVVCSGVLALGLLNLDATHDLRQRLDPPPLVSAHWCVDLPDAGAGVPTPGTPGVDAPRMGSARLGER